MPHILSLRGLTYTTADGHLLFENLDLSFNRERSALIGANGVGKTTLLKLATGALSPSSGHVVRKGTLGMLEQDLATSPGDTIADAFGVRDQTARIARILEGNGSMQDSVKADWTLETRMQAALVEVGLPDFPANHTLEALSGGQRTRVALAALLFSQPDMLVLDEPTNNLDRQGRDAIAHTISKWRGGALIVSHDRALLRQVDRIIELSNLGVRIYGGNWDLYEERKNAEREAAEATLAHAEKKLLETRKYAQVAIRRKAKSDSQGKAGRAKGGTPKIVLNAQQNRAEGTTGRLSAIAERQREQTQQAAENARENVERTKAPSVKFPSTNLAQGKTVLRIDQITFGYDPARPLFQNLSLQVTGPERIALTGHNGSGKTTLLRIISGELLPSRGKVHCTDGMAILDQHAHVLDRHETIQENFRRLNPQESENACRAALARFLFRADSALRKVGELSGGEMLRAALACTLGSHNTPEFLILDEPTNHLDLAAIAAIEAGLLTYDGALLVSSHDEDFLAAINVDQRIALPFPE